MRMYALFGSIAIAAVVILTACAAPAAQPTVAPTQTPAPSPAPSPSPAPTFAPMTIKYGQVGGISDAAIYIAQAKGFFVEQGLTVESVPFVSAAEMTAPLGTDQLQVGGGTLSAGLFNAIGRGVAIVIVADKGSYAPGHGFAAIVVRTALIDVIKGPKDLKGRSLALSASDVAPEMNLDAYLRTGGLTIKDVNIVAIPASDVQQALKNGSIDTAQSFEPFLSRILAAGVARDLVRADVAIPGQQIAVVLFSEKFAAKQEAATRFMVAYIKAARTYNDAFVKKVPATRTEAINILSKATNLDADLFDTMVMPGLDLNGKLNSDSLNQLQDFFVAKGSQKDKVPMSKAVNLSFAEEAARRLGPYQ